MGPDLGKTTRIPLIPLPTGTVLLPGVTLRIQVANRPDIANLLSALLQRNPSVKRDPSLITIGCIPLQSPRLSKDGRHLLEDGQSREYQTDDSESIDAGQARADDLFRYGTVAKLVGIQRRAYAEPYMLVEGLHRFNIVKVLKERPYFEADISSHPEASKSNSLSESSDYRTTDGNG